MNEQVHFAIEHGKRTTDRMVQGLLEAISRKLSEGIEYDGRKLQIKQLGSIMKTNCEVRLLFDVQNHDDTFDHIEFKVTKTGWGRSLGG